VLVRHVLPAPLALVFANVIAAGLGTVTPFCSCPAVPLFIGFGQAGVPLGATFSLLIAAPMVNEVALALLLGMFGWRIALLYLPLGLLEARCFWLGHQAPAHGESPGRLGPRHAPRACRHC
jgi:uncharacterized membrane protein YraQ (UPF0718 family)